MDDSRELTRLAPCALAAHVERCERLLRHPTLLSRLPDRGDCIRARHALYIAEMARREAESSCAAALLSFERKNCGSVACTLRQDNIELGCGSPVANEARRGVVGILAEPQSATSQIATESFIDAARCIGEKHKHSRVPVEAIVRKTFGGSLCEAEIRRIIDDVPPNFFLTHDETMAAQRKIFLDGRLDALRRLRQVTHGESEKQ